MAGPTITNAFAAGRRIRKHPAFQGGRDMPVQGCGWAAVVGGLLCWTAVGAEPAAPPPVMAIKAGALIDGVSGAPRADQVIVIRGNRIESPATAALPPR